MFFSCSLFVSLVIASASMSVTLSAFDHTPGRSFMWAMAREYFATLD